MTPRAVAAPADEPAGDEATLAEFRQWATLVATVPTPSVRRRCLNVACDRPMRREHPVYGTCCSRACAQERYGEGDR